MVFSQIQAVSLRQQVVEQIRTAIIEGRLKPNDHIVESSLTQQLGVSRTPVREALILLEQDGLVVSFPNRGSFVRNFTSQDVADIFSMRTSLENFAGELIIDQLYEEDYHHLEDLIARQSRAIADSDYKVVRSLDMSFHQYIVNRGNHGLLVRNWQQIVAQIAAVLYLRAEAVPDYDEYLAIRDHTAIVQAYRQHDLATLTALNRQINQRVAGECQFSVEFVEKQAKEG
ncbi:MAG: GntR family transcriptional regulator [Chitinophagaceae bacterium]|nr:GntR family transcriptional regulator [Anaerolineae bacterium]